MSVGTDVHLLGFGLDAIIAHTRIPRGGLLARLFPAPDVPSLPYVPSDREREARYNEAAMLHADQMYDLRVEIGERFKAAWKRGQVPDLRTVARMTQRAGGDLMQVRRYAEQIL
jgi:hypothetical protein